MFLTARKFAGGDLSSWNTSKVTNMRGMFACGDPSPSANVFNGDVSTWDVSSVTDMNNMFIRAGAFNQDISSWSTSKVTDMNNMFKGAAAFYQDITGWTTTSLIYSTDMFTDAGAWLNRLERDGTTSTDGPSNVWVHKPCLRDERAQSGWCVPCEPNFIHIEGYDPAVGDTTCDEMTCCQAKMKRSGMIIKRKPKPKPNLNPHLSPYSCASDQGRVVFSLVDDNDVKDLPSTAAGIAAGFYNPNAFYIGNAELEAIDIKSAKMCLERSKARGDSECTTNCVDIVDSLFSCSPGSISSSGTKNMIMAMTGQLEPNTCAGYVFYNEGPGCDSSSTHCWSCHRTAKLGQTSSYNWHAHGWGMNLDRAGGTDELFHYPGTDGECAEVYENGETFWDSFYVVVQE
jgi:surface protein